MATDTYEEYLASRFPPWLAGRWGTAFAGTFGYVLDQAIATAKEGVKAGFVADCPDDGVPYHAAARLIEPYVGETMAALRERVLNAWDDWAASGSQSDLRDRLRLYMNAPDLEVYTPAFDGWATDDIDVAGASRFWAVTSDHPWTQPVVGPGLEVGAGLMVGITMTLEELSRLRRIAKRYKPGHIIGAELVVLFDATPPADILAGTLTAQFTRDVDHVSGDSVRIPIQWPLVGYPSSAMTVGPALVVGREYT